uniref:Small secreted protein n=1 Tax=Rhabditophanes sp. KR3021 TaxID=114890 RepID=A0AC35U0D3_9BILA
MKFSTTLFSILAIVSVALALTPTHQQTKLKKPKGLASAFADEYTKCKLECKKVQEREITETYIANLRSELEAASIIHTQEQAAAQAAAQLAAQAAADAAKVAADAASLAAETAKSVSDSAKSAAETAAKAEQQAKEVTPQDPLIV